MPTSYLDYCSPFSSITLLLNLPQLSNRLILLPEHDPRTPCMQQKVEDLLVHVNSWEHSLNRLPFSSNSLHHPDFSVHPSVNFQYYRNLR